jgi:type I restriction enzyme S subunit
MLVMEMSNKKQQIPAIRFNGFTDAWEQRELKEVSERVRGNDGRMNLPTLTISAGSGWLDQRERFSGNIAGSEQKNYTLLSKGELSYNHGNSKLAKYGVVFALRTFEEALVPKVYHSFKTTDEASADFVEYMFATKRPDRELAKLVSSGARMDGLLNINYDEFMGINIMVPEIDEQNRISHFLRKLDDTIDLHQRQLDNYKQLKKSMLQKIFNQEFRFKDEHENDFPEWENHKLGEVITEFNGKTEVNNQYPPLTSSRRGLFLQEDYFNRQVASKDTTGYNIVPYGYFTYRHMSDDLEFYFNINYLVPNGIVSTLYPVFTTKEIMNSNFLQIILNNGKEFKQFAISQKQGGSRTYMYLSKLKELILNIPCYLEQQEIVNFTLALDKKIELEEQKIKLLRKQKNWFIQQMFV